MQLRGLKDTVLPEPSACEDVDEAADKNEEAYAELLSTWMIKACLLS